MRHIKSFAPAVALSAAFAFFVSASPTRADLVTIGLSFNGGAIDQTSPSGITASITQPGYHGAFNVQVNASGQTFLGGPAQPSLLNSNTVNASTDGAATLTVFVTSQNLTSPTGFLNFLSGFTSNFINGPLTV